MNIEQIMFEPNADNATIITNNDEDYMYFQYFILTFTELFLQIIFTELGDINLN